MIPNPEYNIWEHSAQVRRLYSQRAHGHHEMDSSAQGAELLAPYIEANSKAHPGSTPRLLDAGAGSGYFYHSLAKRNLAVDYYGLDYSPSLIEIGQSILPAYGLPKERLSCQAIEDIIDLHFDFIVLINTLTFCPDFREPLDRLMATKPQVILIRDNFGPETIIRWELDGYLDPGYEHLKAYWNQWNYTEVAEFLKEAGYLVHSVVDRRTGGQEELVVGKSYFWSWLRAEKEK